MKLFSQEVDIAWHDVQPNWILAWLFPAQAFTRLTQVFNREFWDGAAKTQA